MNKYVEEITAGAVSAFLTASCAYLAAYSTCRSPAPGAPGVNPAAVEQHAPTSRSAAQPKGKSMHNYRHLAHRMLLAAGLGAFLAGPVFAEQGCTQMGRHNFQHEQRVKQIEQHHNRLHEALKLTPEQEPGWGTLMDSESAKPTAGASRMEDWSKLSTPERADKMLEHAREHHERMSQHVVALKAFYAILTPEQQKVFDDFHAGPKGGMRSKGKNRTPSADKAAVKP